MVDKRIEMKWFVGSLVFTIVYCSYLFFFLGLLANLEKYPGEILKPEPGQIIAIGLLILIYHFAFAGLFAFSLLGKMQASIGIFFSLLIHAALLYGLKFWYEAVAEGVLVFFGNQKSLPWYAEEKNKFLLAHIPLGCYFIVVFIFRLTGIIKKMQN